MTRSVAAVFGGPTPEHEVSLAGARAVLQQAEKLGWNVIEAGVAKDGRWFVGPGALDQLLLRADPDRLPLGIDGSDVVVPQPAEVFFGPPPVAVLAGYGLALPISHGRWGEDGTLQGLLAGGYGLRVVGCGVVASATCFDKRLTKTLLAAAGLPVTRGTSVSRDEWTGSRRVALNSAVEACGGPWFVKPNRSGSSIGIARARTRGALSKAIDRDLFWDDVALVEEEVPHREWLVGVIGDSDPLASPPLECVTSGTLFDYEQKYRRGTLRFDPPDVPARLVHRARELAVAAFRVLGCTDSARVDLFLDQRTGDLLVNEVNTIPEMTEHSAFPQLMAAAGYDYPALLGELCRLAEDRG